ncbi:helix-turn-helix domain-containing protein [Micromonospora sp. A200]|uniref:helix-turn-helix domain-containing protein n=1 Tax=Micromonospora sp. A200 TaxID=2940568 RepID=UPI002475412B|nr:helix-turn-helix domain-containing protein [Micromonospora sp. A200]
MVRYKYTPEALAEAAAAAHSIAGVMRLLGVRISGGSHAHISRQLKRFGIDTSHFTGNAHNKGRPGPPRASSEVLVKLAPDAPRTPGFRLKRALAFIGLPEQCEVRGVALWQGAPLVLHVDHINGDFLDNRPPNLRLLCPNCHSQTATYAGRKRRPGPRYEQKPDQVPGVADNPAIERAEPTTPSGPIDERKLLTLVQKVSNGELTTTETARRIGCTRDHVGRLRRRLEATGSIALAPRTKDRPVRRQLQESVIRFALAHPEVGSRKIAQGLAGAAGGVPVISHQTVHRILKEAGLTTVEARRSKLGTSAGVA